MAETATQPITIPRRLVSLTIPRNQNIVVDLNQVVAIMQPVTKNDYTKLVLNSGHEIRVIEHYNLVFQKWTNADTIDYSIEGEDEI